MLLPLNNWSFVGLLFFFVFSCNLKKVEDTRTSTLSGKDLFEQRCVSCHGIDGSLGFNGAKNLALSSFSSEQIAAQVTNGKGAMAPFKNILSTEEINLVSEYTLGLRKK